MKYFFKDRKKVEKLCSVIRKKVEKHRELYLSPIKAELWEEILHLSFAEVGVKTDWLPDGNHVQGKDMTLETGERISCKSGSIHKNDLTISGSRLTKHKTLRDKIKFISNKREDSYALLARQKDDKTGKKYKLIMFGSEYLNYKDLDWQPHWPRKTSKKPNYKAVSEALECSIQRSMSDQLWTKIKEYDSQQEIYCVDI